MKTLLFTILMSMSLGYLTAQSDEPFTYVEQMPAFPGGTQKLYKFFSDNIVYPDSCKSTMGTFTAVVQFVVDTEGYIVKPKVLKGNDCGATEEVLRVVSMMNDLNPRWSPGMHNGKKTPVTFTLPVKFIPGKT